MDVCEIKIILRVKSRNFLRYMFARMYAALLDNKFLNQTHISCDFVINYNIVINYHMCWKICSAENFTLYSDCHDTGCRSSILVWFCGCNNVVNVSLTLWTYTMFELPVVQRNFERMTVAIHSRKFRKDSFL